MQTFTHATQMTYQQKLTINSTFRYTMNQLLCRQVLTISLFG